MRRGSSDSKIGEDIYSMFNKIFCSHHSCHTTDLVARCSPLIAYQEKLHTFRYKDSSTASQKPRPPPFRLLSSRILVSLLQIIFGLRNTTQFIAFLASKVEALAFSDDSGDVGFTAGNLNPVSFVSALWRVSSVSKKRG